MARRLLTAWLLVMTLACAGFAQSKRKAPKPSATPAEVRALIDAGAFAQARQLASRKRDPQLTALIGEIDILQLKPADAARRLAPLAATDRRAAWFATLAKLAVGDKKAAGGMRELAAGTRPGEESLAELAWLLEGTLPRVGTTNPAQLEEAARAALDQQHKPEAALALFACRRLGQETAKLQALLDRLAAPTKPR